VDDLSFLCPRLCSLRTASLAKNDEPQVEAAEGAEPEPCDQEQDEANGEITEKEELWGFLFNLLFVPNRRFERDIQLPGETMLESAERNAAALPESTREKVLSLLQSKIPPAERE